MRKSAEKAALPLLMTALLFACSAALAAEQGRALTLGFAGRPGSTEAEAMESLARAVTEFTDGQVQVSVTVLGQPTAPRELFTQLSRGSIDLACMETWMLASQSPRLTVLAQPFVFSSREQSGQFFGGEGGTALAEILAGSGVRMLGWFPGASPLLVTERPIAGAEGIRGLKVGITDTVSERIRSLTAAYSSLSAAVVSVGSYDEISSLLSAGTVSALRLTPAELAEASESLPPSMRQANLVGDDAPAYVLCASAASLDALPEDLRFLLENAAYAGMMAAEGKIAAANAEAMASLASQGFDFPSADLEAVSAVTRRIVDNAAPGTDKKILETVQKAKQPVIMR